MTINVRIRNGLCPDPSTGEGGATEGDIRGSFSDIIDVVGVKDLAGGHALVTENSPADMSVSVAPGVVYIPNADYDELDSNTVKFWEAVIKISEEVVITANTSGSARIDLICAKMDTAVTPDEHASNIATLVAVAGTPGAGAPATPDNYAKLAEVEVANGAATIVNADITDSRVQSRIKDSYLPAVFTGKTFDDELRLKQIATPADPATGYQKLYFKSDGKLYYLDENSIETEVGAGGGGDGYNFLSRQAIINGNFDVWQRNITFTTPNDDTYGPDRWNFLVDGNGAWTFSRSLIVSEKSKYSLRCVNVTANKQCGIVQILEAGDSQKFYNQDLTLSFKARTTTDKVISKLRCALLKWGGTADSVTSDVVGAWAGAGTNPTWATNWTMVGTPVDLTLTTSFSSFSQTGNVGENTGNIAVVIWTDDTTIAAGDEFYIDEIQLCAGDVALPFMPKSYAQEYQDCLRFAYKIQNIGNAADGAVFSNWWVATANTTLNFVLKTPIPMRSIVAVENTSVAYTNFEAILGTGPMTLSAVNYAAYVPHNSQSTVYCELTTSTTIALGASGYLRYANSSATEIILSAEL